MTNNTKQQSINTFTGGFNTDLHPLTTPNDILTDCVNGTVITYNGNEFILQNDMGNYKLQKAILPADYIPIGIKEYGNIIYIVSYNPIDKKCQIGSYPSPQTLFDNSEYGSKNESYQGVPIYSLDPNWSWPTDLNYTVNDGIVNQGNASSTPVGEFKTEVLFTNVKPNQVIKIFFPEDVTNLEDTFLNPGDKYYLQKDPLEESHWKFQKCEYYSLTESKEALKIKDGLVITDENDYSPEKLRNVTWETPGWLGYKPSLIEPTSFDLYLTDIQIPSFLIETSDGKETGQLSFNVQGQLTINTSDEWINYYDNLKVYFDYSYAGGSWKNDFTNGSHISSEEGGNPTNYGNTIDILTFNNSKSFEISEEDIKNNKTIIIRATPYIWDENYGIVYNNLAVTYTINLSELYNIEDIEVFSTYKYLSDDSGVTVNFNITSPTSNSSQITCKYRIHNISENFEGVENSSEYKDIDSLNLLGQNILTIDFESDDMLWFKKENIYIFELAFFNISEWNNYINNDRDEPTPIYQAGEFLITSALLNDYYYNNSQFQNISLSTWTSKLGNYISVPKELTLNSDNIIKTHINSFAKTSSLNNIFDISYYNVGDSLIYDIDETSSDDYQKASNKILSDENNINKSTYYGTISSSISQLNYSVTAPLILEGEGLWGDITWQNSSTFYHQYTNNSEVNTINDGVVTGSITNLTPLEYNVKTIFTNAYFSNFSARTFSGRDGNRWYMYKNIMFGINNKETDTSGNWKINSFLKYFIDLYPWVTDSGMDTEELTKIKSNNFVTLGTIDKVAFMPYGFAQNNHRTELRLALNYKSSNNYNFITLNLNNREKWDELSTTKSNAEAVDNFFTSRDIVWTFIPVSPATGNPYTSGKYWARGWQFRDFGFSKKSGSQSTNSGCICIQCKDGTTKSIAAIKFFPAQYDEDLYGDYTVTDGSKYQSAWLVSTVHGSSSEGLPLPQLNNKMSTCVSALLFGLGIHLFGFTSLYESSKTYIENTGSTQSVYSLPQFWIWATRSDSINKLVYKGIDIYNTTISEDTLKNIFDSINIKKYSISNLQGTVNTVSVSSTTNKSSYIDDAQLEDNSLVYTSFIGYLSSLLTTLIDNWTASTSYEVGKVYSDLAGITTIETNVKSLAEDLLFEYKNGRGYFYYNGLPENEIYSRRGDDGTKTTCLRGLDWSNRFSWEEVPNLFIPTSDFKKSEGLN